MYQATTSFICHYYRQIKLHNQLYFMGQKRMAIPTFPFRVRASYQYDLLSIFHSFAKITLYGFSLTCISGYEEIMRIKKIKINFTVFSPSLHESIQMNIFASKSYISLITVRHKFPTHKEQIIF